MVSLSVIQSAFEFVTWFYAAPSAERSRFLRRERAETATWLQIIDDYPRCQRTVARNRTVPLEVLEKLRNARDFGVQWQVRSTDKWVEAHPDDVSPFEFNSAELVDYDLTVLERDVLRNGLFQWGGPAHCTEELAVSMGFVSITDLFTEGDRICSALRASKPMKHIDWARALLSTEIVFMSNVKGAALDWEPVTGISDAETFKTIRDLQVHLVIHAPFGTEYPRP